VLDKIGCITERISILNNNNNNKPNKPDIVIHDNEKGKCILIDAAIPRDRNVIEKEAEKI
jgi:hypothetical protein